MDQHNRQSYNQFFSRQINCLGAAAQERLKSKTIAIIGLGGLGSHILMTLAVYGIGKIKLVDGDIVSLHNLHRQPLYRTDDEGIKKADCALKFCASRNPYTNFIAHADFISQDNVGTLLKECDLIIDGADSHECSILLNQFSCNSGTPLLAASVEGRNGYVGLFNGAYKKFACHACLFPELPENAPTCSEIGVDPLAVSLTATIQSNLAVQNLLEDSKDGTYIFQINAQTPRLSKLKLEKNKDCAVCSKRTRELKKEKIIFKVINNAEIKNLIDVREESEFLSAPREATNIPMSKIIDNAHLIPNKDIVLCCASGIRSRQIAEFLIQSGFTHEISLLKQENT